MKIIKARFRAVIFNQTNNYKTRKIQQKTALEF